MTPEGSRKTSANCVFSLSAFAECFARHQFQDIITIAGNDLNGQLFYKSFLGIFSAKNFQ